MKKTLLLLLLPLMQSCYDSELVFEDQYLLVTEAYLFKDKQSHKVALSSMISFGSDSTSGEAVSGATVVLESDGESWTFSEDSETPGSYLLTADLAMEVADSFRLHIAHGDEHLFATTALPSNPPELKMTTSSLYIPYVQSMMGMQDLEWPDPIEISWENPDARYYFMNIQNIESNPTSIMPDPPEGAPGREFAFEMITEPTNGTFAVIEARQLTHFGTHRIIFSSVNDEYVKLYSSLSQDSRELNEPYTNIEGGLGIFTAFNSDTFFLEVIPVY